MYKEAIAAFEKCLSLWNGNAAFLSGLAYAYAMSGNKPKALAILRMVRSGSTTNRATSADIAIIYAGLGDKGRALDFLEKACDERSIAMFGLKVGPVYDTLRGERRYAALLARVGLGPES